MKIGIIGTGNVGTALGKVWAKKGHEIKFGTRDVKHSKIPELIKDVGKNATAGTIKEAADFGEIVVLAIPWSATRSIIENAGDLSNKVIIDCVNPISPDRKGVSIGHTTSAAEEIQKLAPKANVVKAFNTIGAGNFVDPHFGEEKADAFICGNDQNSKSIVSKLAEEIGFEVIDVGSLHEARLLEPLAMLWVNLAFAQGMGPKIAFKVLKK